MVLLEETLEEQMEEVAVEEVEDIVVAMVAVVDKTIHHLLRLLPHLLHLQVVEEVVVDVSLQKPKY